LATTTSGAQALKDLTALTSLNLSGNNIGGAGAEALKVRNPTDCGQDSDASRTAFR
jgi:hypothetical protein